MPATATATELQRNYKRVVKRAKRLKGPLTVLSNNKPELVILDYDLFKKKQIKGKSGIDAIFGVWTKEEARQFDKYIEETFEKVDPEAWG